MKPLNPMLTLSTVFKGNQFTIQAPKKARGAKPTVAIARAGDQYFITFALKKLIKGQKFLGLYPTIRNLPNADNLRIGDYCLLGNGEIVQIGK